MSNTNTVRGIYSDLRKIFGIQFQEFIQQFLNNAGLDLDAFFDDVDANQDFLETIVNDWCEKSESEISQDLDAATAIFLMAFLDKIDKETALNDEEDFTLRQRPSDGLRTTRLRQRTWGRGRAVGLPEPQLPPPHVVPRLQLVTHVLVDAGRREPEGFVKGHARLVRKRDSSKSVQETLDTKDFEERRVEPSRDPTASDLGVHVG